MPSDFLREILTLNIKWHIVFVPLPWSCAEVMQNSCCWSMLKSVWVLQCQVSEGGGPEERFVVVVKWAATVDIRALSQFIQ